MKRLGAVIKFKSNVTQEEAARALRSLQLLLDVPDVVSVPDAEIQEALDEGRTVRYDSSRWHSRAWTPADLVTEYDDDWGDPVWYIP